MGGLSLLSSESHLFRVLNVVSVKVSYLSPFIGANSEFAHLVLCFCSDSNKLIKCSEW